MSKDEPIPYSKCIELVLETEARITSIKSGMKELSLDYFTSLPHLRTAFKLTKDSKESKDNELGKSKLPRFNGTGYIIFLVRI